MSDGRELKQEAAPQAPAHSRLETWSHASQVLMAGAVIVSLSFLWLELNENTKVALRNESNATMQQWSSFRQSIYADRETANVFYRGMAEVELADPVEQLRFDYLLREHGWATFQIWDRVNSLLVSRTHFEQGAGPDFLKILCTPGGGAAWQRLQSEFPAPYTQDLQRLAAAYEKQPGTRCSGKPVESAP